MPPRLLHFTLMGRIDRIKVCSRRHMRDEESECGLCAGAEDTLDHFIFECTHPVSVKLRRKVNHIFTRNPIDNFQHYFPNICELLDCLQLNPTLNQDTSKALKILFGIVDVHSEDFKALPLETKSQYFKTFKHAVNLAHKGWKARCHKIHSRNTGDVWEEEGMQSQLSQ